MKKSYKNKVLLMGLIALTGFISMGTAFAGRAAFSLDIPRTQGYAYTSDGNGNGNGTITNTSNEASVSVSSVYQIEAVTFYAGAYGSNGSATWNNVGGVVYANQASLNKSVKVPYSYVYGSGQKMGLRARNHNWSLNTGSTVGIADYH